MDEIRLPQHVVNRIERRWTARFAQMLDDGNVQSARPHTRLRMRRSASIAAGSAAAGGIPAAADVG